MSTIIDFPTRKIYVESYQREDGTWVKGHFKKILDTQIVPKDIQTQPTPPREPPTNVSKFNVKNMTLDEILEF